MTSTCGGISWVTSTSWQSRRRALPLYLPLPLLRYVRRRVKPRPPTTWKHTQTWNHTQRYTETCTTHPETWTLSDGKVSVKATHWIWEHFFWHSQMWGVRKIKIPSNSKELILYAGKPANFHSLNVSAGDFTELRIQISHCVGLSIWTAPWPFFMWASCIKWMAWLVWWLSSPSNLVPLCSLSAHDVIKIHQSLGLKSKTLMKFYEARAIAIAFWVSLRSSQHVLPCNMRGAFPLPS